MERDQFVAWIYNLSIPATDNWLLLGDFNFIRSHENRNKDGGYINDSCLIELLGILVSSSSL
jgi:hypothetical protein